MDQHGYEYHALSPFSIFCPSGHAYLEVRLRLSRGQVLYTTLWMWSVVVPEHFSDSVHLRLQRLFRFPGWPAAVYSALVAQGFDDVRI